MSVKIKDESFKKMLPSSISDDTTIVSICSSIQHPLSSYESDLERVDILANLDEIKDSFLQNLAWQFSLTHEYMWKIAESLSAKRQLLSIASQLHRYKGTKWAIKTLIEALNLGSVEIDEGLHIRYRNGSMIRNGNKQHIGQEKGWPYYRIILSQPITNDLAELLKKAIPEYAPVRSVLHRLDFKEVALRRNGKFNRNGSYNRGEING